MDELNGWEQVITCDPDGLPHLRQPETFKLRIEFPPGYLYRVTESIINHSLCFVPDPPVCVKCGTHHKEKYHVRICEMCEKSEPTKGPKFEMHIRNTGLRDVGLLLCPDCV